MSLTRRDFLGTTASMGMGMAALRLCIPDSLCAANPAPFPAPDATGERIAPSAGSLYRPYHSKSSSRSDVTAWVQVDLGSSQPIEAVKLYPSNGIYTSGEGFPVRYRLECSEDPSFHTSQLIADRSDADYPHPDNYVTQFSARGARGRYVRLTVTRMRAKKSPGAGVDMPKQQEPIYLFAMSKMGVLLSGEDIAVGCQVTADSTYRNEDDLQQLTRPPRPQGEGIITDHPENVTSPGSWKPAKYAAQAPLGGVTLQGGVFQTAMEDNITYLLDSFSVDELLRQFRERAGKPVSPPLRKPDPFWEEDLAGSNAGRFLMGAGNTLRWMDNAELRQRMNVVVDGIAECRQPNGYIMGYPEDTIFVSEHGAYTRAWLTHGLIEAGYAGNTKAFELLRGYYDWYNQTSYLPELLRRAIQGGQGMVANTRLYFTPVGKPRDMQVIQRYFQENYWLDDLSRRVPEAVWQYPYDRPHCYLLTNVEAYLDLYRATGETRYLNAVLGGWELYRNNWENTGGSISIIEFESDPPKSNFLYQKLGENCGSVFWALLNQRLHSLYPEEERYVAEIEKSIYNVVLANQGGSQGIRYHTALLGKKEKPARINTCCEGQGTRLIAALPEHIYSLAPDGIYVNLFEPSTVNWTQSGEAMQMKMTSKFPFHPDVQLKVTGSRAVKAKIRIRVPSWASTVMPMEVNAARVTTGIPGTYVALDRVWSPGDTISFTLPMAFKLTRYTGLDQIAGHERFALEYGPILMAAVGSADTDIVVPNATSPMELRTKLQPKPDSPLHYTIATIPDVEFLPYFQLAEESFSCFPIIEASTSAL